ncbi:hypothetical protein ACM7JK_07610 [Pseudomonas aeruginosa]
MIQMTKIDKAHNLNCPDCGHSRLKATPNAVEVPGGGYFLLDGDTIQGFYTDLVSHGLEKAGDDDALATHDHELSFGKCSSCGSQYFVLQVSMIDDSVEIDRDFVECYFYENTPKLPSINFIASAHGLEWLVERHDTSKGVCLCHTIGPFKMGDEEDEDDESYEARYGRDLLLKIWPDLKALAVQVNAG